MGTIHIISQPHTQLTKDYLRCAYTQKCIKLCHMLVKEGMKVYVYAGEENETPAELVTVIRKPQLSKLGYNGPEDYLKNDFDIRKPLYKVFHQRLIYEIGQRIQPGDLIGTFSGTERPIMNAFHNNPMIELGIGYSGVFADYRVYESYAWQHAIWSQISNGDANSINGRHYDTVIPNYFDINDFPYSEKTEDYILFVGRMIQRKGIQIVSEVANRMPDTKFILAGQGAHQQGNKIICDEGQILEGDNLEYIGVIDAETRGKLMSEAKALICPTLYIGPFEGVHVEALLCGTPVLTTTWGAFTETFEDGIHGFRCHNIKQFVEAANKVDELKRINIRHYARGRYSMDVVAKQYMRYFELLYGLEHGGFYEPNLK